MCSKVESTFLRQTRDHFLPLGQKHYVSRCDGSVGTDETNYAACGACSRVATAT